MRPAPAVLGIAALVAAETSWPEPAIAGCSVMSRHPCTPAFCSVFRHGPCFPEFLPPIGEDLRLTITSTDDNDPTSDRRDADHNDAEHEVNTIRDLFSTLRGCWVPPPKDEARHGMQYAVRFSFRRDGQIIGKPRMTYASPDAPRELRDTYRNAIDGALERCTPVHFTAGMGGAVAGRPIAIRFVDDRTIERRKGQP
jgi:hypothetical protein